MPRAHMPYALSRRMSGPPPPPSRPPPVSAGACADDLTCATLPPSNLPVPGFITTRRGGKRKVEAAVTNPKPPPPKCDTRGQVESPPKRQTRAQAKAEAKEAAHPKIVASVPSDRRGGPLTEVQNHPQKQEAHLSAGKARAQRRTSSTRDELVPPPPAHSPPHMSEGASSSGKTQTAVSSTRTAEQELQHLFKEAKLLTAPTKNVDDGHSLTPQSVHITSTVGSKAPKNPTPKKPTPSRKPTGNPRVMTRTSVAKAGVMLVRHSPTDKRRSSRARKASESPTNVKSPITKDRSGRCEPTKGSGSRKPAFGSPSPVAPRDPNSAKRSISSVAKGSVAAAAASLRIGTFGGLKTAASTALCNPSAAVPQFARATTAPAAIQASSEKNKHFVNFMQAPSPSGETKDILDSFACLLNEAGAHADLGPEMLETLSSKLASSLNFSQTSLFKKLGERSQWMQYKKRRDSNERKQLRILVVGAGPIGLRCAIELALLGHFVHVLEKRHRLNVLHLWEFVEYDLIELGIKLLDPSVFASVDYQHVGTSQLQHSLLKVALLLGVQVDLGAPVSDLHSLRDLASSGSFGKSIPSGGDLGFELIGLGHRTLAECCIVSMVIGAEGDANFDVLVDGTGARCDFFSSLGFEQELVLKGARAIGIVVHFHNRKTAMELQLREANWAHQFWTTRFNKLNERDGVRLQNMVYYRSTGAFTSTPTNSTASAATHYFVFTAEADSLLACGAINSMSRPESICSAENVNLEKLASFSRKAIAEFVPELADAEMVEGQLQIFDFSTRFQSNLASKLVCGDAFGGGATTSTLVTRVGDALQEPFWPEGLGINRGFLHCFDCADMVESYATLLHTSINASSSERTAAERMLMQRREELFKICKGVSGSNRLSELKPSKVNGKLVYGIDPFSRYVNISKGIPAALY